MTLEVVEQFKDLKESRMLLDGVAYNIVFDALCKLVKVEDAVEMVEDINGYCLQGDRVTAFSVFKEMKGKGFKPDVVTSNVLATRLSRNGHACEAVKLLV